MHSKICVHDKYQNSFRGALIRLPTNISLEIQKPPILERHNPNIFLKKAFYSETFQENIRNICGKITSPSHCMSIITLSIHNLNSPIKRCRLLEQIQKQCSSTCCLQETHITKKDIHRVKVKGQKKISTLTESKTEIEPLYQRKQGLT